MKNKISPLFTMHKIKEMYESMAEIANKLLKDVEECHQEYIDIDAYCKR